MSGLVQLFALIAIGALLVLDFTEAVVVAGARNEERIPASWCPDSFYNFGDSLSDTGNKVYYAAGESLANRPPYGESFFGRPVGRFSNGRLVIDYILLSFKLPLLPPSWKATATATQTSGANFAVAGATAAKVSDPISCLEDQVGEFVEWKTSAEKSTYLSGVDSELSTKLNFSSSLYTIEVGGNDMFEDLDFGYKLNELYLLTGPAILKAITTSVQALYLQGARKFLIYSVPAQGCSPVLKMNGIMEKYGLHLNSLGCLEELNAFNREVNKKLHLAVKDLRGAMPDATFIYFDQYSANLEVLKNPAKYGFDQDLVSEVCCDLGSAEKGKSVQKNSTYVCGGDSATQLCDDPELYVNWEGVHFTEHYYRELAQFLLSGVYSDPPTNLTSLCNLSYENFGPGLTFEDVYPRPKNVDVSSSIFTV